MTKATSGTQAEFERILFEELNIPRRFLSEQNKDDIIRRSLLRAYDLMLSGGHDAMAIAATVCLHVASSVVLLESTPPNVDRTLTRIKEDKRFSGIEPTTVVTGAALYYLLHHIINDEDASVPQGERGKLSKLSSRLDTINWMIGGSAMKALGMSPGPIGN